MVGADVEVVVVFMCTGVGGGEWASGDVKSGPTGDTVVLGRRFVLTTKKGQEKDKTHLLWNACLAASKLVQ